MHKMTKVTNFVSLYITDEHSSNIFDDIKNLEVQTALTKAKIRKAIGIDNILNKLLKNPNTIDLLVVLLNESVAWVSFHQSGKSLF